MEKGITVSPLYRISKFLCKSNSEYTLYFTHTSWHRVGIYQVWIGERFNHNKLPNKKAGIKSFLVVETVILSWIVFRELKFFRQELLGFYPQTELPKNGRSNVQASRLCYHICTNQVNLISLNVIWNYQPSWLCPYQS